MVDHPGTVVAAARRATEKPVLIDSECSESLENYRLSFFRALFGHCRHQQTLRDEHNNNRIFSNSKSTFVNRKA